VYEFLLYFVILISVCSLKTDNTKVADTCKSYYTVQLSYPTVVGYSRGHKAVGVANEAESPKKTASISPDDDVVVLFR